MATAVAPTKRDLFGPEHDAYREAIRQFIAREVVPRYEEWTQRGASDPALFMKAARSGFAAMSVPEHYGGAGVDDWRFNVIVAEEAARAQVAPALMPSMVTTDVCLPYLMAAATDEQKQRWLPPIAAGESILAIAMTEPGTGSDLQGVKTRARKQGDHYVLNGAKTFITGGSIASRVIVVASTDPAAGSRGLSLFVVDADSEGFRRGKPIEKIGQHASDTIELFFDDVEVPAGNLLGEEGTGFAQLMDKLVAERIWVAVGAMTSAETVLEMTLDYVKSRHAFGQAIGTFQNSRFVLAELKTEITIGRVFIDRCIEMHCAGKLAVDEAAMAKWWTTELLGRATDKCLQLHGGYGYTDEYPISRAWVDGRVSRIYAGATEIMKEVIGRKMGL